ncbi:MAG TPA: PAS domain-containing protein, partial [Armatimonadota bacterium]|nr:PAS domain-containing protein [Armatimonadota bacterium]
MAQPADELFERVAGARREWMACFDAITDWVFVKARDLSIMKANRAAASIFGRIPQQLIGHTCQELFQTDEMPADEAVVLQTFQTGQPQSVDVDTMPVPGEFHVATYPLRDESGHVVAVVEYVRDVTEQKAMQRQLLQSARLAAVGELAAGVAHNFGNILMGVGGSLEVMLL